MDSEGIVRRRRRRIWDEEGRSSTIDEEWVVKQLQSWRGKGGMTTGACARCKVRTEMLITLIATAMMPVVNATKVTVLRFEVRGR